jgi:hypothetical protein
MTSRPASHRGANQYRSRRAPTLHINFAVPLDDEQMLTALASSPNSPPHILRQLSRQGTQTTQMKLAANPACPPAVLWRLAAEPAITSYVAENPACPPRLLQLIHRRSDEHDPDIVRNPNCPPRLLTQLAQPASHVSIRILVADHPRCPPQVLTLLVNDTAAGNRWRQDLKDVETTSPATRALANPACPPRILRTYSTHYLPRLRATVASNPACPPTTLIALAADTDLSVRQAAAGNPSCPPGPLTRLLEDTEPTISNQAAGNPNLPRSALAMWQLAQTQP